MSIHIMLEKIDECLRGYDCMLIETGGKYDGKSLIDTCLFMSSEYLQSGGNKEDISLVLKEILSVYEDAKEWKYLEKMLGFLNEFNKALHTV